MCQVVRIYKGFGFDCRLVVPRMQYRFKLSGLLVASFLASRRANASPTVQLDDGTFTGLATQNATFAFLGIPFALPPFVLSSTLCLLTI